MKHLLVIFLLTVLSGAHAAEVLCDSCVGGVSIRKADGTVHALASTSGVNIQGFAFVLPEITIQQGDTVTWTNKDSSAHTATSDTAIWTSGDLGRNESFSFTFNTPGEYPYYCAIHHDMRGKITVLPLSPPVITSSSSETAVVGQFFQYQIVATNSPQSFTADNLPPGLSMNATGLISGTPQAAEASRAISLSATNAVGTGTGTLNLQIVLPPAPVISSATSGTAVVGTLFQYQIAATNSPQSFSATNLPAGLSVSASGLISGTPQAAEASRAIGLSATNPGGTGTATLTLQIVFPPAPAITSATSATAIVGDPFDYQILATNNPQSFGATNLPAGLSINASGRISGTPQTAEASRAIGLSATNPGGTGVATLNLQISSLPIPVISSVLQSTAQVGENFIYQLTADRPASFLIGALPAGLSDDGAGLIAGIPTQSGTFQIELRASNSSGADVESLALAIAPPQPIVFGGSFQFTLVKGHPFELALLAGGKAPLSFALSTSAVALAGQNLGLPPGLALQNASLSGTPQQAGAFAVEILCSNAYTQTAQVFTFNVADPTSGLDSDGDGFSDELELALNSSPLDASQTPQGLQSGASAPLSITQLVLRLNFSRVRRDTLSLNGVFPLSSDFKTSGSALVLDVGGFSRTFTLDARGGASVDGATFQLAVRSTSSGAKIGRFFARAGPADLASFFSNEDMANETVRKATRAVKVVLLADGKHFNSTETLKFTSTRNRSSVARK